jgi:DNA-directed RNA polymerase specialized sigma24 family protein
VIDEIVTNTQSPRKNRCWATFFPGPSSSRGTIHEGEPLPPELQPPSRPPRPVPGPAPASGPEGTPSPRSGGKPRPDAPSRCASGEALYPLLIRVRAGDEDALERLAAGVRALLMRLISPLLAGGWTDGWVEDVVGEAVIDVLRAHPCCRAAGEGEFRAWVATIARREVATFLRCELPRQHLHSPLGPHLTLPDPSPDVDPETSRISLGHLPLTRAEREFLLLRLDATLTWAEIGREFGIAGTAAKRRYQRLLRRLRADYSIRAGSTKIPAQLRPYPADSPPPDSRGADLALRTTPPPGPGAHCASCARSRAFLFSPPPDGT